MAERAHITLSEMKGALTDLLLFSAPFARSHGRGRSATQEGLLNAIRRATELLKSPEQDQATQQAIPLDPDVLLSAYIAQGGDWRNLVAAVNRHATEATVQRYQQTKEKSHEQNQSQEGLQSVRNQW